MEKKDVPCTIADRCRVISELLCIKFKFLNMPSLSCAEIDCAISCLCTDQFIFHSLFVHFLYDFIINIFALNYNFPARLSFLVGISRSDCKILNISNMLQNSHIVCSLSVTASISLRFVVHFVGVVWYVPTYQIAGVVLSMFMDTVEHLAASQL